MAQVHFDILEVIDVFSVASSSKQFCSFHSLRGNCLEHFPDSTEQKPFRESGSIKVTLVLLASGLERAFSFAWCANRQQHACEADVSLWSCGVITVGVAHSSFNRTKLPRWHKWHYQGDDIGTAPMLIFSNHLHGSFICAIDIKVQLNRLKLLSNWWFLANVLCAGAQGATKCI